MRTIANKQSKKRLIIIIAVTVALLASGVAAALFIPSSPFALNKKQEDRAENIVDYTEATDDQKKAGEKAKEDFINNQKETDGSPVANNDSNTATSSTVAVTATSANQSDQMYQIRAMIEAVDASGSCTLTLSKAGQATITQDAGTQILGSYSVCKGFDVSTDGIAKGEWQLKITYKGSAGEGSVQRSIGVQ